MFRPFYLVPLVSIPVIGAAFYNPIIRERATQNGQALMRVSRDLSAFTRIVADYKWSLRGLEGQPYKEELVNVHLRSAERLKNLFFKNGGIYIKFGQHIAQLDHLLPDQYVRTMKVMLNRGPAHPYEETKQTFKEDFGVFPEEVFQRFDQTPIFSASLAQVHVAETKYGERVAVKVQHRGLREISSSDIATTYFLVYLVHKIFPNLNFMWLAEEMQTNLPIELDFRREAENSERCAKNFISQPEIAIPKVFKEQSSARILTMEFMEGCQVNDVEALESFGLHKLEVAELLSKAFCQQIFLDGFVHCDPHPGNVFVRPLKSNPSKPQLILLDHGLYRNLDEPFRINYCKLWKSIILADLKGIEEASISLNAGNYFQLFAAVLTASTWDQVTSSSFQVTSKPRDRLAHRAMLQKHAQKLFFDISGLLEKIPRHLLFLLKTNDCLRSTDFALGAGLTSSTTTAIYAMKGLLSYERKHGSWISWLKTYFQYARIRITIGFITYASLLGFI